MNNNRIKAVRTLLFAALCLGVALGLNTAWASVEAFNEAKIIDVRIDLQDKRQSFGRSQHGDQIRRYHRSARRGNGGALRQLGYHYQRGWGVFRDLTKAYMWFTIAGAQGNQDAMENRDSIARSMSSDEIDKAASLAARWIELYKLDN